MKRNLALTLVAFTFAAACCGAREKTTPVAQDREIPAHERPAPFKKPRTMPRSAASRVANCLLSGDCAVYVARLTRIGPPEYPTTTRRSQSAYSRNVEAVVEEVLLGEDLHVGQPVALFYVNADHTTLGEVAMAVPWLRADLQEGERLLIVERRDRMVQQWNGGPLSVALAEPAGSKEAASLRALIPLQAKSNDDPAAIPEAAQTLDPKDVLRTQYLIEALSPRSGGVEEERAVAALAVLLRTPDLEDMQIIDIVDDFWRWYSSASAESKTIIIRALAGLAADADLDRAKAGFQGLGSIARMGRVDLSGVPSTEARMLLRNYETLRGAGKAPESPQLETEIQLLAAREATR